VRNSNVKLGISEITLTYEIGKVFLGYSKGKKDIEFKVSAKSIFLIILQCRSNHLAMGWVSGRSITYHPVLNGKFRVVLLGSDYHRHCNFNVFARKVPGTNYWSKCNSQKGRP
jgi:hypothetical protein